MQKSINCICGESDFSEEVKHGFITGKKGQSIPRKVPVGKCHVCGLIRQIDLPFSTEEEYVEYYANEYPPVNTEYACHNYKEDLASLKARFENLKLKEAKRVLDIGCGSGALIDICQSNGIEAFGCEIVKYHYAPANLPIYFKRFEDIHFPTDHFDKIVCFDVVEHVLDPVKFLKEVFRVLAENGTAYIEFPDFFDKDGGADHWKRIEHIWYFSLEQFKNLLKEIGFHIENISRNKDAFKVLYSVTKPKQERVSVLLPPGIGDCYWSLIKVESFLKAKGITAPVDAYVASPRAKAYNSHARSFPYLEMFPFLKSTGEVVFSQRTGIWHEAYLEEGRSVFEDVLGCDYFLSWNGYLRAGFALDDLSPEYPCNWFMDRFVSLNEENYRKQAKEKYGKYLVLFWAFVGSNNSIFKHFKIEELAWAINKIVSETGLKPVFVGARWDKDDDKLKQLVSLVDGKVNLLSRTTVEEVFGLMRGADAVMGIPSGITIMAAVFKIKTILLWGNFYCSNGVDRSFAKNVFPPAVWDKTYHAVYADEVTIEGYAAKAISVINETPFYNRNSYKRKKGQEYDIQVYPRRQQKQKKKQRAIPSIRDFEKPVVNGIPEERYLPGKKTGKYKTLSILCVLKSGGDYTVEYVVKLRNMLRRHTTVPYEFVCLTDMDIHSSICKTVKLERDFAGWWSKIELFRPNMVDSDQIIYFDLDTVIAGNIDDILDFDYNISGLQPWNERNRREGLCASGMMAWKNDGAFSYLYDEFKLEKIKNYRAGDQEYITEILASHGVKAEFFQHLFPGIYSYKRNCKPKMPMDARIICFHGRPRPHEMKSDKWVGRNWR